MVITHGRKIIPVKFYAEASGREPVREWLLELHKIERKAIGEDIRAVQFRWPIGLPLVDFLERDIWEIRSKLVNRIARTLFAVKDGRIILLHGFIKKTRKTPREEIDLAIKRLKKLA